MILKASRWAACLAVAVLAPLLSGCLIEGPEKPLAYYSHLKIEPDYHLEAAPEGRIYELWAMDLDSTTGFSFVPLVRFQWDPELYLATDQDGNTLPLTSPTGLDVGVNLTEYFALFMTVEPLDAQNPLLPQGPVLLVYNIDTQYPTNPVTIIDPFSLLVQVTGSAPAVQYTLISQSNKKGKPGASWRDGSEGYGIWFCAPDILSRTILDYNGAFDTYSQVFVPPAPDSPYIYTVWINVAHPESSFSNFGRVFGNLEPDINFVDGVPQHPDTMKTSVIGALPLGEEPIYIGGNLVGYRYYSADMMDTCDLRIDRPALTRCTRDTYDSLVFDVQVRTPRQFTLTQGDTVMASTIGLWNLPDLRQNPEFAGIFDSWEYEAWLVFDKSSGIKPMSLGRFEGPTGFDSENNYCITAGFDSNFAFPGEDFLRNLSQHDSRLTDSLNVITDPRVSKLWITVEPRNDPENGYVDWAPDEPYMQLIAASSWIPKAAEWQSTPQGAAPEVTRPMSITDRNPGPEGLNEGHFFPTMRVIFKQAPTE